MNFNLVIGLLVVLCYLDSTLALDIIPRSEWGAAEYVGTKETLPNGQSFVIIHHTAEPYCSTKPDCLAEVRRIQVMHQDKNGWADIGYHFLIGGDGNIYEGRGWNVVGAHASGQNLVSIGISFMGNYNNEKPNAAQISAANDLLTEAVNRGQIVSNYTLYGHRQVGSTECPGNNLWAEIITWPHWKSK
uniref:Peptidoglycan-recognition protein n=1 Tax=Stomoxys calcitrans TaxID=35570 RepID=A0A1I8NX79_STOCA